MSTAVICSNSNGESERVVEPRATSEGGTNKVEVEIEDDLHDSRQQVAHEGDAPLFEGLGENGVVRVRENLLGDSPSGVKVNVLLVNEDSDELGDRLRRIKRKRSSGTDKNRWSSRLTSVG